MQTLFRKKNRFTGKVGLALGSGSARGWAHIGVIRALTEAGIHVDYITGTSIGALVGAVYASGGIGTLENVVLQFDWKQIAYFFDVVLPKSGLLDGKRISAFIRKHVKEINIEELPIPFCAIATDLGTGNEVVLKQGDIIEAVRASISIPGIFTPVKNNGTILVDGALVNPVPVSVAREMGADFVIAVDLNHNIVGRKEPEISTPDSNFELLEKKNGLLSVQRHKILEALSRRIEAVDFPVLTQIRQWAARDPLPSIFEVLGTSSSIMATQITTMKLKTDPPDLLIRPDLGHIKFLEYDRAQETIAGGYREAKVRLDALIQKEERFGSFYNQ
ncbi:MAG: patatin-like phospholipase family protein [Desulfosarcina sp.]|nr:patatin-like phospholipase family protein [Desulfobacterales bacterium]